MSQLAELERYQAFFVCFHWCYPQQSRKATAEISLLYQAESEWQSRNENFTVNLNQRKKRHLILSASLSSVSDRNWLSHPLSFSLILQDIWLSFSETNLVFFQTCNAMSEFWTFNFVIEISKNKDMGIHDNYLPIVEGLSWQRWKTFFLEKYSKGQRCKGSC